MRFSYIKSRPNKFVPIISWVIMLLHGSAPWVRKSSSHRHLGFEIDGNFFVVDASDGRGAEVLPRSHFEDKFEITEETSFEKDIPFIDFDAWINSIDSLFYAKWFLLTAFFKLVNLITFHKVGSNCRVLECNGVIPYFTEAFSDVKIDIPNTWDLFEVDSMTRRMIEGRV